MCVYDICGPEKDLPRKKIKVTVTEWHIRNGFKRNCRFCPTNIALMELVECDVLTNFDAVRLSVSNKGVVLVIPHSGPLYKWVEDFDYSRPVQPFQFEIEMPEKYIRTTPVNLEKKVGDRYEKMRKPNVWKRCWRWIRDTVTLARL